MAASWRVLTCKQGPAVARSNECQAQRDDDDHMSAGSGTGSRHEFALPRSRPRISLLLYNIPQDEVIQCIAHTEQ